MFKSLCTLVPFSLILACAGTKSVSSSEDMVLPGWELFASDIEQVYLDKLGQLYTVDKGGRIKKYDKALRFLFEYENVSLASDIVLDITNPFQIVAFYPDFLELILLDNTLSESTRFDLAHLGVTNLRTVALSNDNYIWLYDDIDQKLKKINRSGAILTQSEDLGLLFQGIGIGCDQLFERNNRLYLFDRSRGLFIFDNLGQYIRHISDIRGGNIYFLDRYLVHIDRELMLWSTNFFQAQRIQTPNTRKGIKKFLFDKQKEIILTGGQLFFRIKT